MDTKIPATHRRLIEGVDELDRLTRAIDLKCHPDARNLVAALVAQIRLTKIHADMMREADPYAALAAVTDQLAEYTNFAGEWFTKGLPEDWRGRAACAFPALDAARLVLDKANGDYSPAF